MYIAFQHLRIERSKGAQCTDPLHVAPSGANSIVWSGGYKHAAPPEQRQVKPKYVTCSN
jgi:hypothetical protein